MERRGRILVVDDEANARTALVTLLSDEGFTVESAADGFKALPKLDDFAPELLLTDLKMPGMDGLTLMNRARERDPECAVVLMTAHGGVESAVSAMQQGAASYLQKPINMDELLVLIDRAIERRRLRAEAGHLRERLAERHRLSGIVGSSKEMQAVFDTVMQVAGSRASVLITGESGTGKELIAAAIHEHSPRAQGPFVRLNCAALAETLLESELFGHERGAFTGAMQPREGRFELAHKGTLLLDEVSEVSPRIQAKLLRVLEEEEFERVGGNRTLQVDVRVIATSNRNLEAAMKEGSFREDLYYRLHVVPIELPPLRERSDDVALLATTFLERFARDNGKSVRKITPAALARLAAYRWPGNVRELSNLIQRAVVLAHDDVLDVAELPLPAAVDDALRSDVLSAAVGMRAEDVERELILRTLRSTHGNRTRTAELLDLTARTINNKIRLYRAQGHDIPEPRRGVARKKPELVEALSERLADRGVVLPSERAAAPAPELAGALP